MNENSEEKENNFNQNFDSNNQENSQNNDMEFNGEEQIGNMDKNFEQFGAINRYPENVDMNNQNINQNVLAKLIFNKDQNVVEEKSNKFLSFLDKYKESFGKYFDVELNDIKQKLKGPLIPFNKSFYQSIETNSDLYGPF